MQVIYDGAVYMRNEEWKAFVKKVARFGVRTGIFDCSLDWRLVEGFGKNSHTITSVQGLGSQLRLGSIMYCIIYFYFHMNILPVYLLFGKMTIEHDAYPNL